MDDLIKRIETKFTILDKKHQRDDLVFLTMEKSHVVDVLTCLRDTEGFRHLVMISAVDHIEYDVFQLTYLVHSYQQHVDLGICINVDRNNPVMDSIHHLWAGAQVYQREIKEMFGIDFPESPRVDEPMILEGWDNIPPLRRDFDTKKYAEETFFPREGRKTHDPRKVMEEQSYPHESKVKYEIKRLVRGNRNHS